MRLSQMTEGMKRMMYKTKTTNWKKGPVEYDTNDDRPHSRSPPTFIRDTPQKSPTSIKPNTSLDSIIDNIGSFEPQVTSFNAASSKNTSKNATPLKKINTITGNARSTFEVTKSAERLPVLKSSLA